MPSEQRDDTGDRPEDPADELARLRAENEALRAKVAGGSPADPAVRRHRRRRRGSIGLAVVAGILLPLAVLTFWTRNLLLDTDRYVETVAPLADDPAITSSVINRLTEGISEAADFEGIAEELLPEEAQPLAGFIAGGASSLTRNVVTRVVESQEFRDLWEEANRLGHENLVAVMTGQDGEVLETDEGRVVVNLGPLAEQVLRQLDRITGFDLAGTIPAERISVRYTLVDSPDLARVQTQLRLFDRLAWWTVIGALAALVAAALVAEDRRLGLRRVATAITASMLVLLVAYAAGRNLYLTNLPEGVQSPAAAEAAFDTITRFLHQGLRTMFTLGVVLLAVAWLFGPGRTATRLRGGWTALADRTGTAELPLGPVPAWVADHRSAIHTGIAVVAGAVVLAWSRPTGRVVVWVTVVALVAVGVTELLAAPARARTGDAAS